MNKYEIVAKWILTECAIPMIDIEWILFHLYENKKPKLTFEEAYSKVLEQHEINLKEK